MCRERRGGVAVAATALVMMMVMVNVGRAQLQPQTHIVPWDILAVPFNNASNFATCNPIPLPDSPIDNSNTGASNFTFTTTGNHYFICGKHCQNGMDITITAN
ncbi:blue copper protein [Striga asiatica]|uniref:Blue copper protein n=1 Tax=Striga asiatica TaxID=4170 RepID=A0A5A7NWR2_STRAF|nr:blue copper protein [Striga asiatica]